MQARVVIGIAALAVGCSKGPAAPASSTKVADELWTLAPEGARFGVVISPQGLQRIERSWLAIAHLIEVAPELVKARDKLRAELTATVGKAAPALADFGLDPRGGAAIFVMPNDKEVVLLPVVDRAKFVAAVHGTSSGGIDRMVKDSCQPYKGHYVCTDEPGLLAKLGSAHLDAQRRAVKLAGDIELVYHDGPTATVAVSLEHGSVTVRGQVTGAPPAVRGWLGAALAPRSGNGSDTGFGHLDVRPLLAATGLDKQSMPGMPELGSLIAGPVTYEIPRGTSNLDLRIPVSNPGPISAALALCTMVPGMSTFAPKLVNGGCRVLVPLLDLTAELRVDGNEVHLLTRGPSDPKASEAPTALARELSGGQWSTVFYGRGTAFAIPVPPNFPIENDPDAMAFFRGLPLVNEVGGGVRLEGDAIRFVFGMRTLWDNPDDVISKLLTITADDLVHGRALARARDVADASPKSPFAADFHAGLGGALALAMPVAVNGAIIGAAYLAMFKQMATPPAPDAPLDIATPPPAPPSPAKP